MAAKSGFRYHSLRVSQSLAKKKLLLNCWLIDIQYSPFFFTPFIVSLYIDSALTSVRISKIQLNRDRLKWQTSWIQFNSEYIFKVKSTGAGDEWAVNKIIYHIFNVRSDAIKAGEKKCNFTNKEQIIIIIIRTYAISQSRRNRK